MESFSVARAPLVWLKRCIEEENFLKIEETGVENVTTVPRVSFCLQDVVDVAYVWAGCLRLNEKFGLSIQSEGVVWPSVRLPFFLPHVAQVVRDARLIFNVPSKCPEKWRNEL